TAMRGTLPWVRAARSTMVGIRLGGRLSTTNQPRSSSTLAAVDRPAPDMPEITTSSGGSPPVCSDSVALAAALTIVSQSPLDSALPVVLKYSVVLGPSVSEPSVLSLSRPADDPPPSADRTAPNCHPL